jgi:hypothetical protein
MWQINKTRFVKPIAQMPAITSLAKVKYSTLPLLNAYEMDICSWSPIIHSPFVLEKVTSS